MPKKKNETPTGDELLSMKEFLAQAKFGKSILDILIKENYLTPIVPGVRKRFFTKNQVREAIRAKMHDWATTPVNENEEGERY